MQLPEKELIPVPELKGNWPAVDALVAAKRKEKGILNAHAGTYVPHENGEPQLCIVVFRDTVQKVMSGEYVSGGIEIDTSEWDSASTPDSSEATGPTSDGPFIAEDTDVGDTNEF